MRLWNDEWSRKVPRDKVGNLLFRSEVLARADVDLGFRKAMREAVHEDFLFYLNTFIWTFDPRTPRKAVPFTSYGYQDESSEVLLRAVGRSMEPGQVGGQDIVVEKSRDMGASWLVMMALEWLWREYPYMSFLCISRKEDLVDASSPDSLFWKIDFAHRHQPEWLRVGTDRKWGHFGQADNGSTLDGESTTAASAVGGRRTAVFVDEFSRIADGAAILSGTADVTNCRIFTFTPWGTHNPSHRLSQRTDITKIRMHWTRHPEKARGWYRYDPKSRGVVVLDKGYFHGPDYNFVMDGKDRSPWYDGEERRRANPREMAEQIDINYEGSQYQFYDPAVILRLREECQDAWWEGDLKHDGSEPEEFQESKGGKLRMWLKLTPKGRPPVSKYGYAAGVDVSGGVGTTNSCLSIVNCETGEKVVEAATAYVAPDKFAEFCVAMCNMFQDAEGEPALLAWEGKGPGQQFSKAVIEMGFRKIYMRIDEMGLNRTESDKPGWMPTPDNQRALHFEYRRAISNGDMVNYSSIALEECLHYIMTSDQRLVHSGELDREDPTRAGINHGDRVIADALAWKMAEQRGLGGRVQRKRGAKEVVLPGSMAWRREKWQSEQAKVGVY